MNSIPRYFTYVVILLSFTVFNSNAFSAQVHGVLTVVKGKVTIKSGKTGAESKAKIGMKVYPKDTILTQDGSRAKVVMVDKNEINISPNSNVILSNYEFEPEKGKKNVLIDVIYGKVRSKVEQKYDGDSNKFQVKTPSAVAGVRGTDFFTAYNKTSNSTQVITFKGQVAFGLPGPNGAILNPVAVNVGQFTSSAGGLPPEPPKAMPKSDLAQFDMDSKAEGPTGPDQRNPAGEPQEQQNKGNDKSKDDNQPKGEKNDQGPNAKNDDKNNGKNQNGPNVNKDADKKDGPNSNNASKENGKGPDQAKNNGPRDPNAKQAGGPNDDKNGQSKGPSNNQSNNGNKGPDPKSKGNQQNGSQRPQPGQANNGNNLKGPAPGPNNNGTNGPPPQQAGGPQQPNANGPGNGSIMPPPPGGNAGLQPPPIAGRDPAGMLPPMPGGTGMMRPEDFASAPNMPVMVGLPPPPTFPIFLPPTTLLPDANVICEFCREVIQDGTTRLIINVTKGQ